MSFKEFISPNFFKIIFLLVFILGTYAIPRNVEICHDRPLVCETFDSDGLGYPMFLGTISNGTNAVIDFNLLYFFANIAIYYLLSCLFYFIVSRFF